LNLKTSLNKKEDKTKDEVTGTVSANGKKNA